MVVHDQNADDFIARVAHETALSVGDRQFDSYQRSLARTAVDSDGGADLGCSAAHRFEPEVPDEHGGGIEAAAIVTDFEDDQVSHRW